jgi:uncharacterized small protein (DUF1192 family)
VEPNPLDLECLRDFDHARFGVLARSLQVLLGRGALDYAIAAVREFARQTRRRVATPASQLVDVLPLRLANALETIGCTTLSAFLQLQDAEVLSTPNVDGGALVIREQLRRELAAGKLLESCVGEELAFDFFADTVPQCVLDYVEGRMNQSVANVSVLDALKILSERGDEAVREIDSKIAALQSEMDQLTKAKRRFKLPEKYKPLSDAMAEMLRGEKESLRPKVLATRLKSSGIVIGKIAANDSRFMRYDDGRIGLAAAS